MGSLALADAESRRRTWKAMDIVPIAPGVLRIALPDRAIRNSCTRCRAEVQTYAAHEVPVMRPDVGMEVPAGIIAWAIMCESCDMRFAPVTKSNGTFIFRPRA